MRTLSMSMRGRLGVLSALVVVWGVLGYACAVEDENPGSSRNRGTDSGLDGTLDSSSDPDAPLGAAICGKYGGYEKVQEMANAIIARAEGDCRIGPSITALNETRKEHFTECFQKQLGSFFQCPGVEYTAGTTTDSKNVKCRSMQQAHQGLNLRKADFDAFLENVGIELAAQGLTTEDVRSIAPAFEGYRTGVVQTQNQPDKNTHCGCPDGKYEGKDCKVALPDAGPDAADTGTDAADAANDG